MSEHMMDVRYKTLGLGSGLFVMVMDLKTPIFPVGISIIRRSPPTITTDRDHLSWRLSEESRSENDLSRKVGRLTVISLTRGH